MAKILTLDDLYTEIVKARKMGMGKKKVILSNDDEGNGFHYCFYAVSPTEKVFGEDPYGLPFGLTKEDLKDYVVIG